MRSLFPENWVVAATCSTFIFAVNRPPWRIMHKAAPPEANSFHFALNFLRHNLSTLLLTEPDRERDRVMIGSTDVSVNMPESRFHRTGYERPVDCALALE